MSNSFFERANPPPRRKTCVACTKAKRRCDHGQPACLRCSRRKIDCVYPDQPAAARSRARAVNNTPQSVYTPLPKDNSDSTLDDVLVPAGPDGLTPSYDSVIPWSQGPDLLPLDLGELEDITLDMGFDDLINPNALLDGVMSIPVAMSPNPDRELVSAHGRPAHTTLEEMIATRLQYALDTIKTAPSLMVLENQVPWCHKYLYRTHMPREMQVLKTIQARAHEILAAPLPKERLDILARIQAILLYQIIRLFDGDIPMRASAHHSLHALEPALDALLPFVKWVPSQPTTGPAEDQTMCPTKDFFHEWIFQESARRTMFLSCFFLVAYQMLVGNESPICCEDRYLFCQSWTLSAHLWQASNVVEFAVAWREKRHFVINKQSFTEVLREASADDVDLFGRILMSGALGIEETRLWFYNRGGIL
ncbi:hypothetical protein CkaCkLH20_02158 [Colletotrichum karsti]|uniref:Zn(2)-C6 fungal-type domain-containing protein n=1 Tax=Colletotrichum karsti TaxID=1095194 RepID=A0A9P6ICB1_9PEZI|nr:uncharacterized protein CkaCkLH20_02158 [Colletotrichum karsti]KAF9880204.1 hypothetical protein CkaCkLH20_02158 [Colletotrichum karsti]